MFTINHKKIFIGFSILMVLASIATIFFFGLNFGIDFKGGSLSEVSYAGARPDIIQVKDVIKPLNIGEALVQPTGTDGFIIKTKYLSEPERISLIGALDMEGKSPVTEKSFNSIGPSVGKELTKKSISSIILVSLAIIIFIALSFRGVSRPVASWKYGIIAIATLLHDITIPVGIFTILSHYTGAEVDTLFVVAILTVLGISIADTIVVFDRIRENLKSNLFPTFRETVGNSIKQVYGRSINTSLTVILVLLSLYFFGPESTKNFALMLTAGMFFGTYSSIFLASPLLVWVEERQNKKAKK